MNPCPDATLATGMAGWTLTLWCLAATIALLNLGRRLPWQNVLATAVIVGGMGAGLALVPGKLFAFSVAGLPPAESLSLPDPPWYLPPFWIATVISCRAVARLVVLAGPQRRDTGLWTLGLASILITVWAMSAQHPASFHTLAASTTKVFLPDGSGHRVGLQLFGWMIAALLTLVAIAPWLINKRLGADPRDWISLAIWLLLGLFFVGGFARKHLWLSAGVSLTLMILITTTAWHGARQRSRTAVR